MKTTLNIIKFHSPCQEGWEKLLIHFNKTSSDDEEFDINEITISNGVFDTLWVLDNILNPQRRALLISKIASRTIHLFENKYPNKIAPRKAIEANIAFSKGEIDKESLASARASAWDSAWDSAWASAKASARASAKASARASARDSAWASASDSARDYARTSAWDYAWDSAWDSAVNEIEIIINAFTNEETTV